MKYYYAYFSLIPLLFIAFLSTREKDDISNNKLPVILSDSLFDMCTVMPGVEVASLSPFNKPIKTVTPDDRMDGYSGCHYDLESEDDYPQVKISLNQFSSAKESKENYVVNKQYWVDMYLRQPDYISNLGDSASFYGNAEPALCDDCGLQVTSGRYYITIAFKGYYEKISAAAKKDAAIGIVRRLFEKKPYLNSRR
jgi:hypothetical protein